MVGGAPRQELKPRGGILIVAIPYEAAAPDRAEYRPHPEVFAEADFYYEREGLPGVCVFCDGPDHDQPERMARDEAERAKLQDLGYRVFVIRYKQALDGQINEHVDVFGPGL